MTIKLSEKTDLKPLTFLGISNSKDGKNMQLFHKDNIKKEGAEIAVNMSHFYTFYPVVKQICVTFGEEKRKRTGLEKSADEPTMIIDTQNMQGVQVVAQKNHTLMLTQKGELMSTGE
jgi:hypothetical protein